MIETQIECGTTTECMPYEIEKAFAAGATEGAEALWLICHYSSRDGGGTSVVVRDGDAWVRHSVLDGRLFLRESEGSDAGELLPFVVAGGAPTRHVRGRELPDDADPLELVGASARP